MVKSPPSLRGPRETLISLSETAAPLRVVCRFSPILGHAKPKSGSAREGVRRRGVPDEQVEAVGYPKVVGSAPGVVCLPVLPDDLSRSRVDENDAVAVVVVRADQSVRQSLGQARVI